MPIFLPFHSIKSSTRTPRADKSGSGQEAQLFILLIISQSEQKLCEKTQKQH